MVEQWREISHPIQLVESAVTYLHPKELRKDIREGRPIKVCYYSHFGKWPEIQAPVIVEPDWDGLREFLDGKEN